MLDLKQRLDALNLRYEVEEGPKALQIQFDGDDVHPGICTIQQWGHWDHGGISAAVRFVNAASTEPGKRADAPQGIQPANSTSDLTINRICQDI